MQKYTGTTVNRYHHLNPPSLALQEDALYDALFIVSNGRLRTHATHAQLELDDAKRVEVTNVESNCHLTIKQQL